MSDFYITSKNFWRSRKTYPEYPSLLRRRYLDLSFVLNYSIDADSILDLGCGDGYLLLLLRELSSISDFYAYDISENLLKMLAQKWSRDRFKSLYIKAANIAEEKELPDTDLTVCFGSFPYIFYDADLHNILYNIKSPLVIVRNPCSLEKESILINKFSEELGANYSAIYRTVNDYISILSTHFTIEHIGRAYPDEIESKYGTKHFFFVCRR